MLVMPASKGGGKKRFPEPNARGSLGEMTEANAARKIKKAMMNMPATEALLRIKRDQASCPRLLPGLKISFNSTILFVNSGWVVVVMDKFSLFYSSNRMRGSMK